MDKINCVKINDFEIKPVKQESKKHKWKGQHIFPKREFFNIALLSKTGSGKTTVIYNLIKEYLDRHTIVLVFSSTAAIDDTYKAIFDYLDKQGTTYLKKPHFKEKGTNLINDWLEEYSKLYDDEFEDDDSDETIPTPECSHIIGAPITSVQEQSQVNERKMNFIIILDDLSQDLRDYSIEKLLKKSRHYRTRVIISSQSLKDIKPNSHAQLYALCLFQDRKSVV